MIDFPRYLRNLRANCATIYVALKRLCYAVSIVVYASVVFVCLRSFKNAELDV